MWRDAESSDACLHPGVGSMARDKGRSVYHVVRSCIRGRALEIVKLKSLQRVDNERKELKIGQFTWPLKVKIQGFLKAIPRR